MTWLWLAVAWAGTFDAVDAATAPDARIDALFTVIDDPALSADHAVAWARLGTSLVELDLKAAASVSWGRAYAAAPADAAPPMLSELALQAVRTAEQIGDAPVVAGPLAKRAAGLKLPSDANERSELAYLVAREELRADNLGSAVGWLGRVDPGSPVFLDAEGLRGVVLSNQGKHADALAPLQSARALAATANRGERHDTKLLLNLARAYYANKNYGQAIYHYMQVPRSSEFWADAHFEQAWAHFRGQDMTGTLGLLHTSTSPFLEQVWAPEAHMLRAQSLFMMCKFTSAIEAIDTFEQQYHPVQAELDAALVGLDAVGAWNDVTGWLDGGTSKLPVRVIRRYQAEDRLAERRRAVGVYDAELGKTAVAGARADRVASLVQGRRDALIADEGARILDAARTRSRELADLLTGIELARIDILQLSSRMYERAAATGEAVEHGDRIGKLRELRKRQKGYDVWPFEGEYWADELGWYQVDARSDCPESMARKIE